jgi:hypothetical protein
MMPVSKGIEKATFSDATTSMPATTCASAHLNQLGAFSTRLHYIFFFQVYDYMNLSLVGSLFPSTTPCSKDE